MFLHWRWWENLLTRRFDSLFVFNPTDESKINEIVKRLSKYNSDTYNNLSKLSYQI